MNERIIRLPCDVLEGGRGGCERNLCGVGRIGLGNGLLRADVIKNRAKMVESAETVYLVLNLGLRRIPSMYAVAIGINSQRYANLIVNSIGYAGVITVCVPKIADSRFTRRATRRVLIR